MKRDTAREEAVERARSGAGLGAKLRRLHLADGRMRAREVVGERTGRLARTHWRRVMGFDLAGQDGATLVVGRISPEGAWRMETAHFMDFEPMTQDRLRGIMGPPWWGLLNESK